MSTARDHHEPISLPVLRLEVPGNCGESDGVCDTCVMRYLERRAEAEHDIASDRLRLRIPIAGEIDRALEARIDRRLRGAPVTASVHQGSVALVFDRGNCPLHELAAALEGLPIRLRLEEADLEEAHEGVTHAGGRRAADGLRAFAGLIRRESQLALVSVGGVLLLAGAIAHWSGGPDLIRIVLLAASGVLTSTATFPEAVRELRSFRLSVDSLMFAAAAGAAALGHYEEGAFLLFLFGLGAAGEDLALHRARRAIDALAEMTPESARVIGDDGEPVVTPIDQVQTGSHVTLRPFERVPLDGEVVYGEASVDRAPVTGEPIPLDVAPGDALLAGMINGDRPLVMRTTRTAGESTLARMLRLVEEAQAEKSKTELFTERIERFYVPAVFVVTLVLIALPPLLTDLAPGIAFYRAMAFLVAASPCALAIGTPAAVLCAVARAARMGVIIKGGMHLETLAKIRAAAFDKTGTLTTGRPRVVEVVPLADADADRVLALAAAVESDINHPIAEAIRAAAQSRGLSPPPAESHEQMIALGAAAVIAGERVGVGKRSLAEGEQLLGEREQARLADAGASSVWVTSEGRPLGLIAIADEPRANASDALRSLRETGVRSVTMLTGDHAAAAEAVSRHAGIEDVRADLLPEDKLAAIESLRVEHGPTMMIGDGVNDAPALARADLGVAIAAAGNDVAVQTADVAVMGGDLRRIADAVRLGRRARRIILQNLLIAMGVIAVVAPLGAAGVAPLGVAVVLHEGSTVVVVLNALRLLRRTGDRSETP